MANLTAPAPSQTSHMRHESHFRRHASEMFAAMAVGMLIAGACAAAILAPQHITWDEALTRYPELCLLGMATGMTAPMVVWMRHRGHSWRNVAEMSATMYAPMAVFVVLAATGLTRGAACGLYCLSTIPAMLAVMLVRRSEYSRHPGR
jgi:flagellar biosynthetic protein FliP